MRVILATAVLLALVLTGLASSRTAAQGQTQQAGITPGEKVVLLFEPNRGGHECTVIGVRGDFVGCRLESQSMDQPSVERWYNLRLVARIERPIRQQ